MRTTSRFYVTLHSFSLGFAFCFMASVPINAQTNDQRQYGLQQLHLSDLSKESEGLHLAAIANGGTYTHCCEIQGRGHAATLAQMCKPSALIFVGVVESTKPILYDDGRRIDTSYTFGVQQVLKGPAAIGQILPYRAPGGSIVFQDGTSATFQVEGEEPLNLGQKYLIFATKYAEYAGPEWEPAALGGQAVLDLSSDGTRARSHAVNSWDIMRKEAAAGAPSLLSKISRIVRAEARP